MLTAGIIAAMLTSYPTAGVMNAVSFHQPPPAIVEEHKEPVVAELEPKENHDLFARVVECEAGNQDELGKRYVIDVILNRVDNAHFPNTIDGVLKQRNQFECLHRSWFWTRRVPKRTYVLIEEEITNRQRTDVLFFRTQHYHGFGTPLFRHGNHYFSGR